MKSELAIDPGRIIYPEGPKQREIPSFRIKHYKSDNELREIIIFCTSLVNNMNGRLRFKFWQKGKYHKALLKTYDELLQKKSKREQMKLKPNDYSDIDDYFCTGTRGEMMEFCSNLLSQMSRFQRFRFVYFLQYNQALLKTHRFLLKKSKKASAKKSKGR